MNRRWAVGMVIGLVAGLVSGCGLLQDAPPTVTPIYITATPEPVIVPIVATETPAATSVLAGTSEALLPTRGPERTATFTPPGPITQTPTFTPTTTNTPVTPGPVVYPPVGEAPGASGGAGVVAGSSSGGGARTGCATVPGGAIGALYQSDPSIAAAIGCPLAGAPSAVGSAYQPFQNGVMIWVSSLGAAPQSAIYALYGSGTYQRFNDTFLEGVDPSSGGMVPPSGLIEPVRGFGKVWRDNPTARDTLGWAQTGESGGTAEILLFERGEMLRVPQAGQTYILITGAPGTWSARAG